MKRLNSIPFLFYSIVFILAIYPFKTGSPQSEIWGISGGGGDFDMGAIYKTDANGENPSIVYSFESSTGNNPRYTKLCEAPNGKLYGMTYYDGVEGGSIRGVIFELDPLTNEYQVKYEFKDSWAGYYWGSYPSGSLMLASDGQLYGMTSEGGSNDLGVIFKFDPLTSNFAKLFDFDGTNSGGNPQGSLMEASNGKIYGMTWAGGAYGNGTIFEYSNVYPNFIKKFDFQDVISGRSPYGDLMQSSSSALFGMTYSGGAYASGVLFEFDPITDIYIKRFDFSSLTDVGVAPTGSLIQAGNGKIYGNTYAGGIHNSGVLFEYDPVSINLIIQFDFDGTSGSYPYGELVEASDGVLYGMTNAGGTNNLGVLYSYNLGNSTLSVALSFDGDNTGAKPYGSLMEASDGILYGMTTEGGIGDGVIFQYDYSTSGFTKIMNFKGKENLFGIHPYGSLISDASGKLYGTTNTTFFEFDPITSSMAKKLDFENNTYDIDKMDDVILMSNGLFCFITTDGGSVDNGAMYTFNLSTGVIESKCNFVIDSMGKNPSAIIQGHDDVIYGTTTYGGAYDQGVVFSFDLNTLAYTKLVEFDGDTMGKVPYELIQVSNGMLYGFSYGGQLGKYGYGVFFKIDPEVPSYSKILDFDFFNTGWWPPNMIEATNDRIYWVTQGGIYSDYEGLLMEYDPYTSTTYQRFNFFSDSSGSEQVSIMQAENGKLYGVNSYGGENGNGIMYEFDPVSFQLTKTFDFNDSIMPVIGNSITPIVSMNALPPQSIDFSLKVYLEGPYYGTGMNPAGETVLPLSQPFNVSPWNYSGNESVTSIPINVVDWVLVELRLADSPGQASSLSVLERKAGLLLTNGRIKDLDWLSNLHFDLLNEQDVYVVVWQRNHLPLMSSVSLNGTGGTVFYNFSTADSKAFGTNAQKDLGGGVFGMYGGDANFDLSIDSVDISENWVAEVGNWGYLESDINGDAQVDNRDKNDIMLVNSGVGSQVPIGIDCGFLMTDFRDGQIYPTIGIGDQCWMARNLNIGVKIDESVDQADNGVIEKYQCPLCGPAIGYIGSGGLYQWDEMMQYDIIEGVQGICPDGWHIPTDMEWCILEQSIESSIDCSTIGWHGSNVGLELKEFGRSGFNVLLVGFRQTNSPYLTNEDTLAFFWSSTQYDGTTAWHRDLDIAQPTIYRGTDLNKEYGLSVRCVKD